MKTGDLKRAWAQLAPAEKKRFEAKASAFKDKVLETMASLQRKSTAKPAAKK